MSCCGGLEPKYTCGGNRVSSVCVGYEKYFPEHSELKDSDCVTIEETTEELYKTDEHILNHLDLRSLGKNCLDYPTVEYKKKDVYLVKDVLKVFEDEICDLKNTSSGSGGNTKYDLKCLAEDPCYKYRNSDDVINLLITKVCELEKRVKELEDGV